jgi:hypothetical protein
MYTGYWSCGALVVVLGKRGEGAASPVEPRVPMTYFERYRVSRFAVIHVTHFPAAHVTALVSKVLNAG